MDVRMPDGTVIKGVPEGTTKSELMRKLNKHRQMAQQEQAIQQEPGFMETLGRAGVEQFLNNVLNLPNLVNQGLSNMNPIPQVAGAAQEVMQQIGNKDFNAADIARASQPRQQERIATPTANDVFAGAQMTGEAAGALRTGDFSQFTGFEGAQQQQSDISQQQREQRPITAGTGRVLGSAASLLAGRAPLARAARDARLSGRAATSASTNLSPGTRKLFSDILSSSPMQKLSRGLGRAGETGIEGATLSILEGGDPLEVAAYGAGGQAAGSLALTLFPPTRKGLVNFAATTAGLAALARLGQEFSPGGNNIFEAIDTAFDKTKYALIGGLLSGVAGAGRIRSGSFADNLPVAAEAITAIPRGAALSFINDVVSEQERGDNTTLSVMDRLSTDPDYFGPAARRRIEVAMRSGKKSVSKEIERLMKNRKFRQKFEELD